MISQTGNLIYEKVDRRTLPLALTLQHQIWPDEEPDQDYKSKPFHPDDSSNVSWLVYYGDELIGLTGVFTFDAHEPAYDQNDSIWMDWFAILPEFRGRGFGKQVLLDTIEYCRKLQKHRFFRIDTTYQEGRPAIVLYDSIMEFKEKYVAESPDEPEQYYLVYSLSLDGSRLEPWNNRLLNLNGYTEGI